jgi:hypothetical protein
MRLTSLKLCCGSVIGCVQNATGWDVRPRRRQWELSLCGCLVHVNRGTNDIEEPVMDGKARFIFPIAMAFFMALLMTGVVTFMNLGLPANFLGQWMKAFAVAWPLASCVAFVAVPLARRITSMVISVTGP